MSTATLKRIALICMILDHTAEYLPGIPSWFRWIGRISAPLFTFLFVQGIDYTKDRKRFVKRLYTFNAVTSVLMLSFNVLQHRDEVSIDLSNILGTFTAIYFLIYVIEKVRKKEGGWKRALAVYVLCQIVSTAVCFSIAFYGNHSVIMLYPVFVQLSGNIFFNEGRLFWILLGVMLYYTKHSRGRLAVGYALMVGAESFIWMHQLPGVLCTTYVHSLVLKNIVSVLGYDPMLNGPVMYDYYQWMMIFTLPFMCLYNGERGKYHKLFYYIFYPLHLAVLLGMEAFING